MPSEVFFSTNQSDWENLEGLYVAERKPAGFIRGSDLSVVGFAGACVRGPTTPVEINSPARFAEVFGERDYFDNDSLRGQVWAALINKKFAKIVVRRVAAAAAVKGTVQLLASATPIVRVDASSVGAWSSPSGGTGVLVSVEAASDGNSNHWNLRVKYRGKDVVYKNLDTTTGNDNTATVLGNDIGNLVVLTKLANGRPDNVVDSALASGADGSVAVTDYTAGITDIANYPGISVCLTPENPVTMATFNAALVTLAAQATDRTFLTWSGSTTNSVSTEKTAKAAQITTPTDRICWCYNAPNTIDPKTGVTIAQGPHVWLAGILSQVDVDIHPGSHDSSQYLAGINSLANETLVRQDLIDLKAAGISTLERLPTSDGGGFIFRSVVGTDTTPGKTEFVQRRMRDFLQLSASNRLKYYVKEKNTRAKRAAMIGELTAFSRELQSANRVIDDDSTDAGPGFVIQSKEVNTTVLRGRGIEKILWRVRLISHMLYLVLETDMATGLVADVTQTPANP